VTAPLPLVFANVTTVVLSELTRLSFASRTSTVSVFVAPAATLAVVEVKASFAAVPGVTVKVEASEVRPVAVAVMVTEPAVAPVTTFCAIPPLAVAVPSPVTVPLPLVFANVTTVELSELTRLSFASRIAIVSVLVAPEATLAVVEVKASFVAAPGVTVNVDVSEASPVALAVTVTDPAVAPVTTFCAIPPLAVALPSPVTVPAPLVFANVTTVELFEVTRWSLASRISTVSVFVAPEATLVVVEVKTTFAGAPTDPGSSAKSCVVVPPPATDTPLAVPVEWPGALALML
jgi:hypothetical protein